MAATPERIETLEALLSLYGAPGAPALRKVARRLTPLYRKWILSSRLCVLSTVGAGGTDGSPRGDDVPLVIEVGPETLAMPDWRGNNRLDSLRNIVEDGRVSLMFMVPGSNNVVRVNGQAFLTADPEMRGRFVKTNGQMPTTVIMIEIDEIYTQCARALLRAGVWSGIDQSRDLPSVGQILSEMTEGEEGGTRYDSAWAERAAKTMW